MNDGPLEEPTAGPKSRLGGLKIIRNEDVQDERDSKPDQIWREYKMIERCDFADGLAQT